MNAPWVAPEDPVLDELRDCLLRDGYCIARNLVKRQEVIALSHDFDARFRSIDYCNGLFFGQRTKRFNGLLKRSHRAVDFVLHATVLRLVEQILTPHCERVQLNLTQAIEIDPGEKMQAPHRDEDMWQVRVPGVEYLVNVMWPLSSFTAANGATRLWPATHRSPDLRRPRLDEAVVAEMEPGDVLIHLGSTIHCAGANHTAAPRRGMVVGYSLGWLKPSENMSLTYPPDVARRFPRKLTDMLGYRRHSGNLGNYDGQCPSKLLDSAYDELGGATEDLSEAHNRVLERFAAVQNWS